MSHRCPTWFEPWGRPENTLMGQLREFSDDSLTRLARQLRRDLEDGNITQREFDRFHRPIRTEQLARLRLRMRYGATFLGTGSYDCYYRLDEAPSYRLAALMDRERWVLGERYVLYWGDQPPVAARPGCPTAQALRQVVTS